MSIDVALLNGRNGNPVKIGNQRVGFFEITFTTVEPYVAGGIDLLDRFKPWGITRVNKMRITRKLMPAEPAANELLKGNAGYFPTMEFDQDTQKLKMFSNDSDYSVAPQEFSVAPIMSDLAGVEVQVQVWGDRS